MPAPLRIDVDRYSPVPLYHQIAQSIERSINDGTLAPGSMLENEVALAARLGVSRPTARQALRELVDHGLLVRRRGVGTQVAHSRIRRPVDLTSLHDDLEKSGRKPETILLEYVATEASASIAELMEVPEGTAVVTFRRLRLADGEPLALMTNTLVARLAPSEEALRTTGLYELLRAQGVHMRVARQRIGARLATASEARRLDEPARAALLTMERTAYDDAGAVIEHGYHIYRASRYIFDTTLVAR